MRRTMILALGLLMVPAVAAAQVELGLDFFGFSYTDTDGAPDPTIGVSLPVSGMRVGFLASPQMIIETRIQAGYDKEGEESQTGIFLVPGINYLITPQVYVRGEAGLSYLKLADDTGSASGTQYLFGGAVGTRRPLGPALLRLEAGVAKGLENTSADLQSAGTLIIHASVGVSAVIN